VSQILAAPAPESDEEKAVWTQRVDYAKSVGAYVEYALFATAVGAPPATIVDLISTLEQQNPKSKYLEGAYAPYLVALNQTGAAAKIPAIAEKGLANFPDNVDLLGVLGDAAFAKQQNDRALALATRLIAAFGKPKPEVVPDAEWTRKRSILLGRGYWTAGVIYGTRNDYNAADKNLRAALPLIQGNTALMSPALFYLGLSNYQLGKLLLNKVRVLEAAKFSEQCAAIPGPYADQARHNALVSRSDADKMR
jgi:tetratricopeptide (TPR) repeat protein